MKTEEKIEKGKWFYYWKKVQGRVSASDYIFIEEERSYIYEDENHLGECLTWAEDVDNCGNYSERGFQYGFDDVERPPQEWIDKKIKSIEKNIEKEKSFLNHLKSI